MTCFTLRAGPATSIGKSRGNLVFPPYEPDELNDEEPLADMAEDLAPPALADKAETGTETQGNNIKWEPSDDEMPKLSPPAEISWLNSCTPWMTTIFWRTRSPGTCFIRKKHEGIATFPHSRATSLGSWANGFPSPGPNNEPNDNNLHDLLGATPPSNQFLCEDSGGYTASLQNLIPKKVINLSEDSESI